MHELWQYYGLAGVIGAALIGLTCLVHYETLRAISNWLPLIHTRLRLKTLIVILGVFCSHIIAIWIYAVAYYGLIHYAHIGDIIVSTSLVTFDESLLSCLYFSATTYTSLGYGDVVPTDGLRMLAGIEALNGLVLIGWSASFIYLVMERFWSMPYGGKHAPKHKNTHQR